MNDDTLIVTETEGDTFDLQLSESSTPETFRRRAASLTGSGLSESEARHVVATTPVPMELFCDSERGIFAVEAEPRRKEIRYWNDTRRSTEYTADASSI